MPTSSPTTTRLSRSTLLILASTMSWPIWTSDIATAFLEGRPQSRKLWVQLPTECLELLGASADTRMLLLKPCYAPTAWYLAAVDKLKAMGLKQHPQDPCCFLMYEGELNSEFDPAAHAPHLLGPHGLCGMVIMHVDDMLGCGSTASQCYNDTIAKLKSSFTFREWKTGEDGKPLTYCVLIDPELATCAECTLLVGPVMVTDAKALFDSYHREGVSSSVVDKRVSLEIRIASVLWAATFDGCPRNIRSQTAWRPDQGICSAPTGSTPSSWSPQAGMGSLVQSCQEEN